MIFDKLDALQVENKQIIKQINLDTKAKTVVKAKPVTKKGNTDIPYQSQWVITEISTKGGFAVLHRYKSELGYTETDAQKEFNRLKKANSSNSFTLTYASYQGNYPKSSDYIELDRF